MSYLYVLLSFKMSLCCSSGGFLLDVHGLMVGVSFSSVFYWCDGPLCWVFGWEWHVYLTFNTLFKKSMGCFALHSSLFSSLWRHCCKMLEITSSIIKCELTNKMHGLHYVERRTTQQVAEMIKQQDEGINSSGLSLSYSVTTQDNNPCQCPAVREQLRRLMATGRRDRMWCLVFPLSAISQSLKELFCSSWKD